jgi:hypothetical protein
MSTRVVGVNVGGLACSWIHYDGESESVGDFCEKLIGMGHVPMGYGPSRYLAGVNCDTDLKEAMSLVWDESGHDGFAVFDWVSFEDWDMGKRLTPKRKQFESDFERLSADGKLLTREPVSAEDAWRATVLACGGREAT